MLNPVALEFFGLKIYWYGITYVLGFLFSYFYISYFGRKLKLEQDKIDNMYFYFMILSVIGGRVFEIVFYNISYYLSDPIKVFYVWQGGMSIHGGFTFGFLTLWYFSRKYKVNLFKLTDLFCVPAALALAFGRLANFINQELVGIPTTSRIGVVFPLYDDKVRWPTQIFESIKNMLVFQVLFYVDMFKQLKPGFITAYFLILYNVGRFFIDFLRVHDVSFGFISMGQSLCLIYGFLGFYLFWYLKQQN